MLAWIGLAIIAVQLEQVRVRPRRRREGEGARLSSSEPGAAFVSRANSQLSAG